MTPTPQSTNSSEDWGDFVSADPSNPTSTNSPTLSPIPPSPITTAPSSRSPTSPSDSFPTPTSPHLAPQPQPHLSPPSPTTSQPLQGFDTLDPVQRYALGAVAVVLLNFHSNDLNGAAFARSQSLTILSALGLRSGQQTALLELDTDTVGRKAVIDQCVNLVGDDAARFCAVQAMLALAVAGGVYDARSRSFLKGISEVFGVSWRAVAAVELAVALKLMEEPEAEAEGEEGEGEGEKEQEKVEQGQGQGEGEGSGLGVPKGAKSVDELLIERRKRKKRVTKAVKITGITLVGGVVFGLTGGLIAPALLTALAGVGVTSAAGLAATGTFASASVVGGLFGAAGAGFTVKKARHRISTNLEEFDFERADDPRVIEERKRKEERERKKMEKLIAERLREESEMNGHLAIESGESNPSGNADDIDVEKELPRPQTISEGEEEEYDDDERESKSYRPFAGKKKKKKKREKLKVGRRGLEAASHIPSLHVCICVPAWFTDRSFGTALDQFEPALKQELPCSQHIALRWESRRLYEMGLAFAKFWASKATVTTVQQAYPHAVAAASTVAGAVAFAFAMPLTIMSCMDYVDNPWSILVSRSNGAGDELADVLVERSYGQRPVTLFGYSIGARVVFKCLESLASRGALGIVDNVFLMGAPVTADPERWKKIRPVVAGRIVNAYGSYDWALAFFHRGCGHGVYVSGLRRVELEGVENLNMGYLGIEGHRELKDCVPRVMKAMGLGVGYIMMPPAKLVRKKSRSRVHKGATADDSPVCEEPERLSQREKGDAVENEPSGIDEDIGSNVGEMRSNIIWTAESPGNEVGEEPLVIDDEFSLPPNVEGLESVQPSSATAKANGVAFENLVNTDGGPSKKKKSSWLSWNSWTISSSKYGRKSKTKKGNSQSTATEADEHSDSTGIPSIDSEYIFDNKESGYRQGQEEAIDEVECSRDRDKLVIENGSHDDGGAYFNDDVVVAEGEENEEAEEAFDWEKQRQIWEEQERQMQEKGYADSAAEIEMRNKMVLGVGIEVAGRRICPFLEQDAELPLKKKEEIFTNCLEDQRGVVVRVYEHEKRTKSVSINMLKRDELYPKLLGEMELPLREAAVKGKLRIAVALWTSETGDVWAEVEERFADGNVGERAELMVERSDLCTVAERSRLETAERKRIEAQLQKEMRNRAQSDVLALPAATGEVEEGEMVTRDIGGGIRVVKDKGVGRSKI